MYLFGVCSKPEGEAGPGQEVVGVDTFHGLYRGPCSTLLPTTHSGNPCFCDFDIQQVEFLGCVVFCSEWLKDLLVYSIDSWDFNRYPPHTHTHT